MQMIEKTAQVKSQREVNMITFNSYGCLSETNYFNSEIGCQVDSLCDGLMPTYGVNADLVGVKCYVFNYSLSNSLIS